MNLGTLKCTNYRFEIDLHGPQYYARRICLQERLDVSLYNLGFDHCTCVLMDEIVSPFKHSAWSQK